jgi:hypothetical protein
MPPSFRIWEIVFCLCEMVAIAWKNRCTHRQISLYYLYISFSSKDFCSEGGSLAVAWPGSWVWLLDWIKV